MDKPKAIGVHVYSGAFTVGVSRHFDVVGQFEEIDAGYDTFALNFPDVYHPLGREGWVTKDKVNLVYANPPCAPWSMAGGRLGKDDPRLEFTKNSVDLALELKPEFFVLESVCRAWTAGKEIYTQFADKFRSMGYGVTVLMTNSMLHGSVQSRDRFHLIAHRYKLPLETPVFSEATVPRCNDVLDDILETARWLDEEPVVPNHVVKRNSEMDDLVMSHLQPGEGWNDCVTRLRNMGYTGVRRGRMIAGRLHGEVPSRTVLDVGAMVHPKENRRLTLREGARLCGYPDDFVFATGKGGDYDAKASDVSQAVIPPMGDYIGSICAEALVRAEPVYNTIEVVDWRPIARPFTPGRMARRINERS